MNRWTSAIFGLQRSETSGHLWQQSQLIASTICLFIQMACVQYIHDGYKWTAAKLAISALVKGAFCLSAAKRMRRKKIETNLTQVTCLNKG